MRQVWKYKLDQMKVPRLPERASVVHFGLDGAGDLCVWVDVPDPEAICVEHGYTVHGTGHAIPAESSHVATVVDVSAYVWHMFRADGD